MAAHQAPHSWNSPGKNTGVGCHFLLQCMKVKSESEVAQLCPAPSDPMDCSPPGSSVHGILQARVLEWGASAFSSIYTHIYIYIYIYIYRCKTKVEWRIRTNTDKSINYGSKSIEEHNQRWWLRTLLLFPQWFLFLLTNKNSVIKDDKLELAWQSSG